MYYVSGEEFCIPNMATAFQIYNDSEKFTYGGECITMFKQTAINITAKSIVNVSDDGNEVGRLLSEFCLALYLQRLETLHDTKKQDFIHC